MVAKIGSIIVLIIMFSATPIHAQEPARFDPTTLRNSIKCELGMFAGDLKSVTIDPLKMQATLVLELKTTKTNGGGFTISLPLPPVSPNGGWQTTDTTLEDTTITETYNIHADNTINCRKVNRVDTGVLTCLRQNRPWFVDAASGSTSSVTCKRDVTASSSLTASGKIPVLWFINVGPTYNNNLVRDYSITITAPPAKDVSPNKPGNSNPKS